MKLKSTLDPRPGMMHVAPMMDSVMLLLVFFLLGSSFVVQSGIAVDVPVANASLQLSPGAHLVTVAPGEREPKIYFNDRRMSLMELDEELDAESARETREIVLRADELASWGICVRVMTIAKNKGYSVAIGTRSDITQ